MDVAVGMPDLWPFAFLIRTKTDPKTVQTLLRLSDVKLTLQFYSQPRSDGGGRKNGDRNSQPRGGPKRTENGLRRNAVRHKFFKNIVVR